MTLELLRILLDFGLVVLIWMVQLLIYPSFIHFSSTNLIAWHKVYTKNMALVVMPLMLGQLVVYTVSFIQEQNSFNTLGFGLTLILWASTFFQFVPLHNAISKNQSTADHLKLLVKRNWIRSFLWSVLFVLSLLEYASLLPKFF
jgi:hypothetical protein